MVVLGKNGEIAVSRGDSAYLTIEITGEVPENGTAAVFTVKKDLHGKSQMIKPLTAQDGLLDLNITSQDTNRLEPGNYFWDLRILHSETDVNTPTEPKRFKVLEVAGDV